MDGQNRWHHAACCAEPPWLDTLNQKEALNRNSVDFLYPIGEDFWDEPHTFFACNIAAWKNSPVWSPFWKDMPFHYLYQFVPVRWHNTDNYLSRSTETFQWSGHRQVCSHWQLPWPHSSEKQPHTHIHKHTHNITTYCHFIATLK